MVTEYMTPQIVRTFARAGYDWLWLDNEHSHHSYESIQEVIRTAEDLGVITLLRVTQGMYHLIARGLDMGGERNYCAACGDGGAGAADRGLREVSPGGEAGLRDTAEFVSGA